MSDELKILLEIPDMLIAEEIQRLLEESGIPSLLESDNPASSLMGVFAGPSVIENVSMKVNNQDYQKAIEIVSAVKYLGRETDTGNLWENRERQTE